MKGPPLKIRCWGQRPFDGALLTRARTRRVRAQIRRKKSNNVFCGFGHLSEQEWTEVINDFPSIAIDLSGDSGVKCRNFVDGLARNFASDTLAVGDRVSQNFVFDLVKSRPW